MRFLLFSFIALLLAPAAFAGGAVEVEKHDWDFQGLPKEWDKDQLYRGYAVATQVCMTCHGMKYINHRQLMDVGFTEAEVKAMAAELNMSINDKLVSGIEPEDAKELYGKEVPDLSLINKARAGLADYTYAVLVGYSEDPDEIHHALPDGVPEGAYYNRAFPGHAIAMPSPLTGPDLVEYHDETEASIEQMAKDVTYFLQWTAEPELLERKKLGVYVLLYLLIFTVLAYLTKRAIWRDVH